MTLAARLAGLDFHPSTLLTLRRRGVRPLRVVELEPGVRGYEVASDGAVRAMSYAEVVALAEPIKAAA